VVRVLGLIALISMTIAAGGGVAQACGGDSDNPMTWDEGFGVARCAERGPRYHIHDFDGEGARGYAVAADPMVWDDAQWRSTLFGGYARSYDRRYDQRARPHVDATNIQIRLERHVEVNVREGAGVKDDAKPRGPKLLNVRTRSEFKTNPGVLRFGGHDCRGVLVLTWGSLGSKSRCYESGGRSKTP
jgi:hypothetical protein